MASVEEKLEDLAILLGSISESLAAKDGNQEVLASISDGLSKLAENFNPKIDIKIPTQPAPKVKVDIPPIRVEAPQVNMAAPEVLPPDIIVNVPEREHKPTAYKVKITERGSQGINALEIIPMGP